MPPKPSLSFLWQRLKRNAAVITAGGSWSVQLPSDIQRNLRWYFMDGVFSASQEAINVTYLTLFVLALGASKTQIGLMTSLASLSAVVLLLPGALLSERLGQRKWVVIASGGGVTRLTILGLALLPFFAHGSLAVWIAIALKVLMDGFSNLGMPAWTSLTADIVPLAWRGRFFSTRNIVMGAANMLVTFIAGQIITLAGTPIAGYQIVYALAFFFGMSASFSFSHIQESRKKADPAALAAYKPASLLNTLQSDANFRNFAISQMVWNFGLGISAPFFSVYQVEVLKATPAVVGILSIISSLAGLPALRLFGGLNDRWGAYKLTLFTGFLIPLVPVLWVFTSTPWHPAPIQVLAGALWAGYGLASFNLLLLISTPQTLPRYTALFQMAVMISSAVGSAAGGFIVQAWGFPAIFILSGILRLAGIIVFWKLVKTPTSERK